MSSLIERYKDLKTAFEKGQLIGVDIGASKIKVCVLSEGKKGRYKIDKYSSRVLSEAAVIEDEIQKPEEIIDTISDIVSNMGVKKKIACIGLKGPNTITKRLQVPNGSKEDIEDNILWESEQYIPFGADDAEIDFSVIGIIDEEDVVDAIVGALKTDVASKYSNYLKQAGLSPKVIDLNVLATVNAFENIYDDRLEEISEDGAIILDFGAQYTTIIVYKNNAPVMTREIGLGGVLVTEEIQRTMGVSYEEAEDLKVQGDDNGNLPEEILSIIENHNNRIIEDLRKILNFYIAAGSSEQVQHCFVTGGSARLPGIIDAVSDLVDLDVEVIDPFSSFELKAKKSADELDEIKYTGLVALGLGMRSIK